MNAQPDDFAAVPILMDLVADEAPGLPPAASANDTAPAAAEAVPVAAQRDVAPPRRALRREDQQPLFADLPAAELPVPATAPRTAPAPKRAAKPAPGLQRMAEEMLRARAPAIVDELAGQYARELSTQLQARLRSELAGILADLAAQDPPGEPGSGEGA